MLLIVVSVIVVGVTIKILRLATSPKCKCPARLEGKTVLLIGGNAGETCSGRFDIHNMFENANVATRRMAYTLFR